MCAEVSGWSIDENQLAPRHPGSQHPNLENTAQFQPQTYSDCLKYLLILVSFILTFHFWFPAFPAWDAQHSLWLRKLGERFVPEIVENKKAKAASSVGLLPHPAAMDSTVIQTVLLPVLTLRKATFPHWKCSQRRAFQTQAVWVSQPSMFN